MSKIMASAALAAILVGVPPVFAQGHPATFREIAKSLPIRPLA